jgi:hypothetical protein
MSDYNKATNFTAKDSLPTGNAGKIIKGTEIDTEFTAISAAVASKADINSPSLTGTPTAPTASTGTSTTQLATTSFVTAALSAIYPVGSIYINAAVSTNPNTLLGFGTWTAFGAGKVIVGLDSGDALFDTLEETGGSKDAVNVSHTHTATSTDAGHAHATQPYFIPSSPNGFAASGGAGQTGSGTSTGYASITTTIASAGVSATNANVQPFIVVRMWKRTA